MRLLTKDEREAITDMLVDAQRAIYQTVANVKEGGQVPFDRAVKNYMALSGRLAVDTILYHERGEALPDTYMEHWPVDMEEMDAREPTPWQHSGYTDAPLIRREPGQELITPPDEVYTELCEECRGRLICSIYDDHYKGAPPTPPYDNDDHPENDLSDEGTAFLSAHQDGPIEAWMRKAGLI